MNCIPIAPFDRPVVVVASGPSLTLSQIRHIGMARAQDRCRVIAINDAIYPCWFADLHHGCDRRWWLVNEGVPAYKGIKTTLEEPAFKDVRKLENTGIEDFDDRPGHIRSGSNGGYQAVHIAAQLGAKKIILVGFDYTDDGARDHFFGKHEGSMDKHSNVANWRKHLRGLTDELGRRGIKVFNATIRSTIDWLPRVSMDSPGWLDQ